MGGLFDRWLFSKSWRALVSQFFLFAIFFAIYDATVLYINRAAPHGMSLVNYVVRDERTDESVMYVAEVRDLVDRQYRSTDPYLKEHRDAPSIRPRVPAWIGYFAYCLAGSMNGAVVLLHTILPAIGAVMLVWFFAAFVSVRIALALAILSIGSACYALNNYLEWLHLAKLAGPYSYIPEMHLFMDVPNHVRFNRFFSPGITFPLMLIGLLPLARDPNLDRRVSLIILGLALGLQLYVYPHALVFLGFVGLALLTINAWGEYQRGSQTSEVLLRFVRRSAWIATTAALLAIPYVREAARFHVSEASSDILSRIGFIDEYYTSVRTPVMLWLALALVLKIKANRAAGHSAWHLLATPMDRVWLALLLGSTLSTWLPGLFSEAISFPTPWLIPLRIVSYFVPLVVGYPLGQWILARQVACPTPRWAARLRAPAIAAYAALLVFAEVAAAVHNAESYKITDEMAQFQAAVLANTAPDSIVMTDNLRLAAWLVCETDRNSFIGYGASSNASNVELLQRLMTVSLLQGKTFDEFYHQCYSVGVGLPAGPNGEHWTLHHGRTGLPYNYRRLRNLYAKLAQRTPEKLLFRYRCDFVYLPHEKIATPFAELLAGTSDPSLQKIDSALRPTATASRGFNRR